MSLLPGWWFTVTVRPVVKKREYAVGLREVERDTSGNEKMI
jgi:hypothetical protein